MTFTPTGTAVEPTDHGGGLTIYAPAVRGRSCGSCKACCTLVPVQSDELTKAANERCPHLCSRGCSIYANRPAPCAYWSCRWLFDPETGGLKRPDLSGYIVDCQLDTVVLNGQPLEAFQVWVDPKRREAHNDPALRAYLALMAERFRMPAIIRWGSYEALVLAAPCLTKSKTWESHYTRALAITDRREQIAAAGPGGPLIELEYEP